MTDTFEFTLDEESEKKLFAIMTEFNTEKIPSFTITDKYGHTAKYVKVVHGRWKCISFDRYICSVCGCEPWYGGSIRTLHYCPNCGALMRKEE